MLYLVIRGTAILPPSYCPLLPHITEIFVKKIACQNQILFAKTRYLYHLFTLQKIDKMKNEPVSIRMLLVCWWYATRMLLVYTGMFCVLLECYVTCMLLLVFVSCFSLDRCRRVTEV